MTDNDPEYTEDTCCEVDTRVPIWCPQGHLKPPTSTFHSGEPAVEIVTNDGEAPIYGLHLCLPHIIESIKTMRRCRGRMTKDTVIARESRKDLPDLLHVYKDYPSKSASGISSMPYREEVEAGFKKASKVTAFQHCTFRPTGTKLFYIQGERARLNVPSGSLNNEAFEDAYNTWARPSSFMLSAAQSTLKKEYGGTGGLLLSFPPDDEEAVATDRHLF